CLHREPGQIDRFVSRHHRMTITSKIVNRNDERVTRHLNRCSSASKEVPNAYRESAFCAFKLTSDHDQLRPFITTFLTKDAKKVQSMPQVNSDLRDKEGKNYGCKEVQEEGCQEGTRKEV